MTGAIGILFPNNVNSILSIPIVDKEVDIPHLIALLKKSKTAKVYSKPIQLFAYIEMVWKPVTLIRQAGIVEGVVSTLNIPIERVHPSAWRKEILGNYKATKKDALTYCRERYPEIKLSRVKDHNFAEALCVAEYCKKQYEN